MTKEPKEKITMTIDKALLDKLKRLAAAVQRSLSNYVGVILAAHVEEIEKEKKEG